jgi:hypothetical protein
MWEYGLSFSSYVCFYRRPLSLSDCVFVSVAVARPAHVEYY